MYLDMIELSDPYCILSLVAPFAYTYEMYDGVFFLDCIQIANETVRLFEILVSGVNDILFEFRFQRP